MVGIHPLWSKRRTIYTKIKMRDSFFTTEKHITKIKKINSFENVEKTEEFLLGKRNLIF